MGLGRSRLQELLLLRSRTIAAAADGRGDLGEALVGEERSRGGGLWIGGREDFWIKGAAIWIDKESRWESRGIPRWEMSAAAAGTNLLEFRVGR